MNGERLHEYLKRFVEPAKHQQLEAEVKRLLDEGVNKGEIFRQFTKSKGNGKSHVSGHYPKNEGKLKNS